MRRPAGVARWRDSGGRLAKLRCIERDARVHEAARDTPAPRPSGLPLACTLPAGNGADRVARWRALSDRQRPVLERVGRTLAVVYPAAPGVREELEALAAAERDCCAFAEWTVTTAGERVVLRVEADPDSLASVAELFGA